MSASTNCNIAALPSELITEIVSIALANRDPPLSVLAQVGRAWAHEARRQRFASLRITWGTERLPPPLDGIASEEAGELPLPFAHFVRTLHLARDRRSRTPSNDVIFQVGKLLQSTTEVESIHLGLDSTEVFDSGVLESISKLPHLHSLRLAPNSRHELTAIPNFPGLSLYVNKERQRNPSPVRESVDLAGLLRVFGTVQSLTDLDLKLCGLRLQAQQDAISGMSLPLVTSLTMSQAHFPNPSTMASFLAAFPSLTRFDYSCHIGGHETYSALHTALSSVSSNLVELRLALPATFVEQPGEAAFLPQLSQLSMPKLDTLFLHIRPIDLSLISGFADERYPSLRHVVVRKGPGWSKLPKLCDVEGMINAGRWASLRNFDLQEFLYREGKPPTETCQLRGGLVEVKYWQY